MSYSSLHHPVYPAQAHFPVFPPAQPVPRGPPQPQSSPKAPVPTSFKAPAHKHAHHLHSIPPREKSTRTLIIDHMLWVHARTRFAQARAELGMTDRTGGPSSPHFRFRERPEQYDEEDEVQSEGEEVDQLKARGTGHEDAHNQDEDTRMQKQDFGLARSLRLRAIALEKVVSSMLDQPPPIFHSVSPIGDETQSPPGSPQRRESQTSPKAAHPHTLPNGVRLRLALGTVINDLFARQAQTAPYRHHHHPPPIVVSNSLSEKGSESMSSNGSPVPPNMSPHPSVTTSQSSTAFVGVLPPSLITLASISGTPGARQYAFTPPISVPSMQGQRIVQPGAQVAWNDRVRALYMDGTDPSTANSPPALRCPRHFHTGCEICVEAKQFFKAPGGPVKGRTGAWGGEMTSRPPQIGSSQSPGGSGGGITGWQDGGGIGSGLAHPGIHGSVLRRKSKWFQQDMEDVVYTGSGAGNTRLAELIPRFLRLSALVAMELGQELVEDEYDSQRERSDGIPSVSPVSPHSPLLSRKAQSESEASPLRPSRDWYMLFAGLLTRAALEGYLTGGWRGPDAAACLLSVGLGLSDDSPPNDEDDTDLIFEWFDPDELPTLKDAAQVMFPSLSAMANGVTPRRENAEAEFAAEMKERLRRFYAIPPLTPDLSTHMEDLAWHFPAEPVERAAVRFCEAVARWRGKPELETYKKRSKDPTTPAMTIESLVHSNPTSPTAGVLSTQPSFPGPRNPTIEQYFIVPQSLTGRKRRRSGDEIDRLGKRVHSGAPVSGVSSHP